MNVLYKKISVWKREDERTAIKYNCFELIKLKKYCVQSADYYSIPIDSKDIADLSRQYLDLFLEEAPENRGELYDSLEEAIEKFDSDFD
ncbi:hypothetical protein QSV34_10555 [Porticoccus sp. W117]|uniref:hypothetical protein n=1 Tax=Porticoccus sp. W117 TaxID=3054777 RepID=UPI0025943F25|nr:hypothetical protein [Porticoccus sp. W117]MDM3871791.1 hypothetical protein [Porticoccus sp. W117]